MDSYLLTQEVRVTANRPKTPGHEPTLSVALSPVDPGERPCVRIVLATVLERLERVLLVVREELHEEREERQSSEDLVRRGERGVWLRSGDGSRDAEKEEDDVLDDGCDTLRRMNNTYSRAHTDEGKVHNLEEPRRDTLAEHSPAVIFVTEREQASAVGVVGQARHPDELDHSSMMANIPGRIRRTCTASIMSARGL
jgi:hypothetical protein